MKTGTIVDIRDTGTEFEYLIAPSDGSEPVWVKEKDIEPKAVH